jgi:hypothetical protein
MTPLVRILHADYKANSRSHKLDKHQPTGKRERPAGLTLG